MSAWLTAILEIIKLTIPALIVFWTVNTLLRRFLEGQQQLKALEVREKQQQTTIPLKLQALERLSLFCERISVPNLLLRINDPGGGTQAYKVALMLAIQHEFEHNITQQVYVSQQLWSIIKAARDDTVSFIDVVADKLEEQANVVEFRQALLSYHAGRETSGLDTALLAIKKEASLVLG